MNRQPANALEASGVFLFEHSLGFVDRLGYLTVVADIP
jgi:hypothetical protein